MRVIHLLVSIFLKITGAKYRQVCFPDFTTVDESVLSILNMKKGASNHMELLRKSGQLSNMVIFKAPCQIGGENSHATDPGKPKGSHFLETENRDCMPSSCRGKLSHASDPINQRAAISSRWRIVIPCLLRIESARQAKRASASLRVDPLNGMLRKR